MAVLVLCSTTRCSASSSLGALVRLKALIYHDVGFLFLFVNELLTYENDDTVAKKREKHCMENTSLSYRNAGAEVYKVYVTLGVLGGLYFTFRKNQAFLVHIQCKSMTLFEFIYLFIYTGSPIGIADLPGGPVLYLHS